MIDVQSHGSFTSSSFKSAEWTSITAKFLGRSGLFYDNQQLQKQHAELKKKYCGFLSIKENSGFEWNAKLKISTDQPEVWDEYLAAHPSAEVYRTTT